MKLKLNYLISMDRIPNATQSHRNTTETLRIQAERAVLKGSIQTLLWCPVCQNIMDLKKSMTCSVSSPTHGLITANVRCSSHSGTRSRQLMNEARRIFAILTSRGIEALEAKVEFYSTRTGLVSITCVGTEPDTDTDTDTTINP